MNKLTRPLGALHLGQDLVSPQDHQTRYQYTFDTQNELSLLDSPQGVFLEARAYIYSMRMFYPLTLRMKG